MNIFTHNGIITVSNPKSGQHRTFRIKTVKNGPLEGKRILSILTGPDNTSNYKGIAFVGKTGISIWNKYKGTQYEKSANSLYRENQEKWGMEVNFEGRCRVCDKVLSDPISCKLGIGPVCRGEK